MAAQASRRGKERKSPVLVQSQYLRERHGGVPAPDRSGFAVTLDAEAEALAPPQQSTSRWRQADVERAVLAAQEAGLTDYRVEIAPDSMISIIVGTANHLSTASAAA